MLSRVLQIRSFVTNACKRSQARWTNPETGRYVGLDLTPEEKKRRAIANIKFIRQRDQFRNRFMSPESKLMWKLESTRRKLAFKQQQLKSLELPPDEVTEHDPEILTKEQLQAIKKLAFMNKNYVPVGIRGIFGGTIENIHQHWKFHETCQIDLHMFPKTKIKDMAAELARLSGGIVVGIQGTTVYMYRGRNYMQPNKLIPANQLSKREALIRARCLQSKEDIDAQIDKLTARLERLRQESDVAGLVEKIAFLKPERRKPRKKPPSPKYAPVEYAEYTEDEIDGKKEKPDSDETLVTGTISSDEFDYTSADDLEDEQEDKASDTEDEV